MDATFVSVFMEDPDPTAAQVQVEAGPHTEVDFATGVPIGSQTKVATSDTVTSLGDGHWLVNWDTGPGLAGTCRVLSLQFDDGAPDRRVLLRLG